MGPHLRCWQSRLWLAELIVSFAAEGAGRVEGSCLRSLEPTLLARLPDGRACRPVKGSEFHVEQDWSPDSIPVEFRCVGIERATRGERGRFPATCVIQASRCRSRSSGPARELRCQVECSAGAGSSRRGGSGGSRVSGATFHVERIADVRAAGSADRLSSNLRGKNSVIDPGLNTHWSG